MQFKGKMIKKKDMMQQIQAKLQELGNGTVYVGIPEGDVGNHDGITNAQLLYLQTHGVHEKGSRLWMSDYMGVTPGGIPIMRDFNLFMEHLQKGMPYSAAYEMYQHEHGSPLWQIPPRPVLEPAIKHYQKNIAEQLKAAAQAALSGEDPTEQLNKAGQVAENAAKDWFTNPENRWVENSPATIKQKGSARPLIDTGNLRNAIRYVVRKKS